MIKTFFSSTLTLDVIAKNSLPTRRSWRLDMFSLVCFNSTHSKLCVWWQVEVQLRSFACGHLLPQHCIWERQLFFHWMVLSSVLKINLPLNCGFILVYFGILNFITPFCVPLFKPIPYCFDHCRFVLNFVIGNYESFILFYFSCWFLSVFKVFKVVYEFEDHFFPFL